MFLPVFVFQLSVCLLARLVKNACMDLDEMLRVDRFFGMYPAMGVALYRRGCRDMDELINF